MGKLFISYRRADADFVHRLAEKLDHLIDGHVFIDRQIDDDDFVEALTDEIRSCNVFLLAVTPNTFAPERIHSEDDWIRREIALALSLDKPIALALREYLVPPHPDKLPADIRQITNKEGKPIYIAYFDEGAQNIAQHCVNISKGALKLRSQDNDNPPNVPDITQTATGEHIVQQAVGQVTNSTVIGYQNTIDNRRQDALAKLETLRRDKAELMAYLYRLQQQGTTSTAEGNLFLWIGILIVISVLFMIHTVLATLVVVGGAFYLLTMADNTNAKRKQKVDKVMQDIHWIDQEMVRLRQLEEQL